MNDPSLNFKILFQIFLKLFTFHIIIMNAFIDKIPSSSSSKRKGNSGTRPDLSKKTTSSHHHHRDDDGFNSKSSSKTTTTTKSVQMYLDFGQRSFGKQIECKKCTMRYVEGDIEDETNHKSFCLSQSNGHVFTPPYLKQGIDYYIKHTFEVLLPSTTKTINQSIKTSSTFFSSKPTSTTSFSSKPVILSELKIITVSQQRFRSDVMMKLYEDIFAELNSDQSFTLPEKKKTDVRECSEMIDQSSDRSQTDLTSESSGISSGAGDETAGCFMCVDDNRRILGCIIVEKVNNNKLSSFLYLLHVIYLFIL